MIFTQFERDAEAGTGVMFDDFVTAVGMYVYTNEGARSVSIFDIAVAFNTTPVLVREAVGQHPWLHSCEHNDPRQEFVTSDGE